MIRGKKYTKKEFEEWDIDQRLEDPDIDVNDALVAYAKAKREGYIKSK